MNKCERCGKLIPCIPMETCSPRGTWRKGMDEGVELALDNIKHIFSDNGYRMMYTSIPYSTAWQWIEKIARELKQGKSDE